MTENQEKELFIAIGGLVKGVKEIQSDVSDIKTTLEKQTQVLHEHSQKLDNLDARTISIAAQLVKNDIAITDRVSTVERAVEGLGGKIH
jgi:methyl-accepting chemotaxis protein